MLALRGDRGRDVNLLRRESVVELDGQLDVAGVAELRRVLADASAEDRHTIVVDFAGVTSIDVSCLAVLVGVQRRAQDEGRRLRLRNVGDATRAVLERSGLDHVLTVEEPTAPA